MVGVLVALVVLFLPDGLVSLWPRTRRMRLVRRLVPGMRPGTGKS